MACMILMFMILLYFLLTANMLHAAQMTQDFECYRHFVALIVSELKQCFLEKVDSQFMSNDSF